MYIIIFKEWWYYMCKNTHVQLLSDLFLNSDTEANDIFSDIDIFAKSIHL